MLCARCGKQINRDSVNWTIISDDEKPLVIDFKTVFAKEMAK